VAIFLVGSAVTDTPGTSVSVSYRGGGGTILVAVCNASLSSSTYSSGMAVTDSGGNTWQISSGQATSPPTIWSSSGIEPVLTYIAWCVNANPVTSVTLKVPSSLSTNFFNQALVAEFANVEAFDTANTISGASGSNVACAPLTLSAVNELIIVAGECASEVHGAPTGFTEINTTYGGTVSYGLGQSGSFAGKFPHGNSGDIYVAASVAFLPVIPGVDNFPDGVADDAIGMIPNIPAPERTSFTGEDLSWVGGPKGWQPITSTNPDGDIPGVSPMSPALPWLFKPPA
jgi:hypothetical protein